MYNSIEQLGQGRGGGSSPTQALVYLRTTYISADGGGMQAVGYFVRVIVKL